MKRSSEKNNAAPIILGVLILLCAAAVIWAHFDNTLPDAVFIAGAAGAAACSVTLIAVSLGRLKRKPKPAPEKHEPYVITDPLFKRIKAQYKEDGLSDLVNYISLRGWKLGYVDEKEDSVELVFTRKERQVGVSLLDGYAEICVDMQDEQPEMLLLSMENYSEPIELWNAIVTDVRDTLRRRK